MVIFLMIVHLTGAAAILAGWRMRKLHLSPVVFPVVFFLPLWGPAAALILEMHVRGGEKADEDASTGPFGITDEVYRSIRLNEEDVSDVLPMEDVLQSGSPARRRSLLLSILHSGPEEFVKPLRIAGVNDDTEVVHYAVTALVELRSEYAQRLAEMEHRLAEHPNDPGTMYASASLDEEFLKSGIPETHERTARMAHCRNTLEKLLQYLSWQETCLGNMPRGGLSVNTQDADGVLQGIREEKYSVLSRLAEICLMQEDADAAREAAGRMIREQPAEEKGYVMLMRTMALCRDGQGIQEVLRAIRDRGVYLSPEARQETAFWEGTAE